MELRSGAMFGVVVAVNVLKSQVKGERGLCLIF